MRIGLDVMGGDFAPKATIAGAILARHELPQTDQLVLFGDEKTLIDQLKEQGSNPELFQIVHADQVIEMGEHPVKAFQQKQNSSIAKGFRWLQKGKIDAFSSAGNTGAMLVGAIHSVNVLKGIIRPAITSVLPKASGGIGLFVDVGLNPDAKPDVMYQFGLLGSIYAKHVLNIDNPKVGLLNIGEEDEKGNLQTQATFKMMKNNPDYNFIGNVEGRDLFKDTVDVVVCDGFVGNVVLKTIEAMYAQIVKRGYGNDEFFSRFNFENYGGTPILGVNASVIVGHGISNAKTFKNMLILSKEVFESNIPEKIKIVLDSEVNKKIFDADQEY